MKANVLSFRSNDQSQPIRTAAWIVIVTTASIALSLSFACATPLAAVATLAGVHMKRHEGAWLVLTAWLANQVVGYYVLHYPRTWDSFAWGAAIGIASLLAAFGARWAARTTRSPVLSSLTAFLVAFLFYEGALFAATAVLPSSAAAFSLPVIARIFGINACAATGLAAIHWLAVRIGLQPRRVAEHVALSHG
jgi:hypothetical protein